MKTLEQIAEELCSHVVVCLKNIKLYPAEHPRVFESLALIKESVREFHAWFRLTRTIGKTVDVVVRRDGETKSIRLPVARPANRTR